MFLCYGYLIIGRCFSDEAIQKALVTETVSKNSWNNNFDLDNVYGILSDAEIPSNHYNIYNNRIESQQLNIADCIFDYNTNIQEQSDKASLQSTNYSDDSSYNKKNTIQYDVSNNNFNIHSKNNSKLLISTNLQPQINTESHLLDCNIEAQNSGDINSEEDYDDDQNLDILNQAFKTVFSDIEIGKRMLQSEQNTNKDKNKKLKVRNSDSEYSEDQNVSRDSNIIVESGNQNCCSEFVEELNDGFNTKRSSVFIEGLLKKIRTAMYDLNKFKPYQKEYLKSKIHDKSCYSSICSDLNKLNVIKEDVTKLYKGLLAKQISNAIEDSDDNRNIFAGLLELISGARGAHYFFKMSIYQKIETLKIDQLAENIEILENKIVNIEELIKSLKNIGIESVLLNENLEQKLIKNSKRRNLKFLYQEKNSSDIQSFKVSVEKKYYPELSFSTSNNKYIFLCLCNYFWNLKIFKIDLDEKTCEEIHGYKIIGKDGIIRSKSFGYGTKHSIIRSDSDGNLVLLKSSLKKNSMSDENANNFFEMLSIDNNCNEIACIQVDPIKSLDNFYRPAIFDLVIHNYLVYALDMKYKCIKIFSLSFELLKIIPFPKDLFKSEIVHLAVSTKYILLGAENTLYCINNNVQYAVFKKLEFDNCLLNVACYNEQDIIILRFDNGCYSFKVEENLTEIKLIHLSSFDPLLNLPLSNFVIKENFLYSYCVETEQIFRLNI